MTMMTSEEVPSNSLVSTSLFQDTKRSARKLKEKITADALAKFQRAQNDRFKQEQQWYLNLAFYFGQHYTKFKVDPAGRRFDMYTPPAPYWRVRPVINQVRKIVRKDIARLTAQQPNAYIIPSSMEDRDIFAAQAGEQIWSSLWRELKFNHILRQAVFWQVVCGNGFITQFWDQYKYDKLNGMQGDINLRAVTPFHIFVPDLKEEELENQTCVIHAQVRPREWVKQQYGIDVSASKHEIVDESLLSVLGLSHQDRKDTTIILEVWEKPGYSRDLPNGGMFTIAGTEIVQGFEGNPYQHGEYPFTKLDGIPTGKFYNDSIINDLIPLQRELNRSRAQIIEAKNRMAKPQWMAEEGSIDPAKMTTEPGQVNFYKPGFATPTAAPLQNLPSYVTEEINRLYTDIADLSGQHEVSQGQTPPGVTAAVAISYLQEQDESLISTFYDSIEEGTEKTARHCLNYVQQYWTQKRTIRLTGLDSSFDVQAFDGSDIRGNTDIRTESGSALPTSRAAKQAFITDLMKMNFIDPKDGLEILEIGGLQKIYERVQVDTRQAQRENLKMRVATVEDQQRVFEEWEQKPEIERIDPSTRLPLQPPILVPVHDYDNHAVHIEVHNNYRKSQAFEMANSFTKKLFEEHVKQHMEALIGQAGINAAIPPEMAQPLDPGQQEGMPPPEGEMDGSGTGEPGGGSQLPGAGPY